MLRTQIYLPEEYHSKLAIVAKKSEVSKGAVIRKILKKALDQDQVSPATGKDLLSLAKLKFVGRPKNLSSKFNDYLYG